MLVPGAPAIVVIDPHPRGAVRKEYQRDTTLQILRLTLTVPVPLSGLQCPTNSHHYRQLAEM